MKANVTFTSKTVSLEALENALRTAPDSIGSTAGITQLTDVKILKKDRDTKEPTTIERVQKLTTLSVFLNTAYESGIVNAYNAQLKASKVDEEVEAPTAYKKGVNTMPLDFTDSNNHFFGTFNGKGVIQYRPNTNIAPTVRYFVDGVETDVNDIPNILPIRYKATNQGTEKEILWRKLYVSNLVSINFNNQSYKLDTANEKMLELV